MKRCYFTPSTYPLSLWLDVLPGGHTPFGKPAEVQTITDGNVLTLPVLSGSIIFSHDGNARPVFAGQPPITIQGEYVPDFIRVRVHAPSVLVFGEQRPNIDGSYYVVFLCTKAAMPLAKGNRRPFFANEVAAYLMEMGLSQNEAWRLIRITGPRMAVETLTWLQNLCFAKTQQGLYQTLCIIARKSQKTYSKTDLFLLFDEYRLIPPEGTTYQQILNALRAAKALGMLSKKIRIGRK